MDCKGRGIQQKGPAAPRWQPARGAAEERGAVSGSLCPSLPTPPGLQHWHHGCGLLPALVSNQDTGFHFFLCTLVSWLWLSQSMVRQS